MKGWKVAKMGHNSKPRMIDFSNKVGLTEWMACPRILHGVFVTAELGVIGVNEVAIN